MTLGRARILRGRPASPGRVGGPAILVRGPDDFEKVKRGDIVVSKTADRSLAVVMDRAGALVTDLGGVLSHAVVIALERGIPAVVSTRSATHAIRDGMLLVVDGEAGTVRLVD